MSKGNHEQNKKKTHKKGENTWKRCDQRGINLHNKDLIQFSVKNNKKLKQPNFKKGEDLNRHFPKDIQIAKRHMKRSSMLLTNRQMQIKTIMRYYPTPDRIAIEKATNNKSWRGCREKGTSFTVSGNVNWWCHWGEL